MLIVNFRSKSITDEVVNSIVSFRKKEKKQIEAKV